MSEGEADPGRCSLCGAPNHCAMALPLSERPAACWCAEQAFPADLLVRAPASSCICAACLDAAAAGGAASETQG